mmetsp:Transcript_66307/g.128175  ORF Transcript_66307/g.128175 Transcript_66307/m.128175 type:complete len:81 (+) Transcript_66307:729-971(+)
MPPPSPGVQSSSKGARCRMQRYRARDDCLLNNKPDPATSRPAANVVHPSCIASAEVKRVGLTEEPPRKLCYKVCSLCQEV